MYILDKIFWHWNKSYSAKNIITGFQTQNEFRDCFHPEEVRLM
jgi:hypothetical protein